MSQSSDNNLYRVITKAVAIFGGVQVVGILCSVIRTKVIAVLLGSVGIGIIGLYNNAIETITALTGLGIRSSSVREISDAHNRDNNNELSRIVTVVRRWSWFVGLLGALVLISLSPLLSRYTFGDNEHIWGFVWLSCTLLFNALASGEQAVLQGTKQLKRLARCSVYGSFAALVVSVPLYYFMGLDGIVPSLILYAAATLIVTLLYKDRTIEKSDLSMRQTAQQGREMVTLGVFMTVSSFITTLFSYIFAAYLNARSGEAAVGYYQAGFTLMNKYVGLIFTAMAMEYYPRLSGVAKDNASLSLHVGKQVEMMQLMLAPIIAIFIVLHPVMVRLLYTSDFYTINGYLLLAIQGISFKAISWSIGFVLLAKGSGKLYFITELLSDTITLTLNIVGYHYFGLAGVGASYTVGFILYLIIIYAVCRHNYNIEPGRKAWGATGLTSLVAMASLGCYLYIRPLAWIITLATIVVCAKLLYDKWQGIEKGE
ncbi:MAG: O-antigen translocase [Bacteroidaceae bacterium]|nr:O-antigen translocase [Bacteroidaceae bacterium]